MDATFWQNRRVLITGHTGFKGAWLALWLAKLGASVVGYSNDPPARDGIFDLAAIGQDVLDCRGDVRDLDRLSAIVSRQRIETIFHLAAQPLVRRSFAEPVDTFSTNVMGTVNVLEAARHSHSVQSVIVITTDKCYENNEWLWGYRENDRLGGHDPYSASKACAELVASAYRKSFFATPATVGIATARAGNVIGGGDWAEDRLVPDAIRAMADSRPIKIRNPHAVRPWQHVFEPLCGYLMLAERLRADPRSFSGAWNFGPPAHDGAAVGQLATMLVNRWGNARWEALHERTSPHESHQLRLDSSQAHQLLGWQPQLNLEQAVQLTVEWYRAAVERQRGAGLRGLSLEQLSKYEQAMAASSAVVPRAA